MWLKRLPNLGAAFCGLAGSIVLFCSLTITASPFRPVMISDGTTALCFNGKTLVAGYGGPLVLSNEACQGWNEAKPAALVSAEHPMFVKIGFVLLALAFVFSAVVGWRP
jgi:hypothetical protein